MEIPTGDQETNLRRAIAAYEAALTVYGRTTHPVQWAGAQNNLANAWSDLPGGQRGENLLRAIAAYESALDVYTSEAHPVQWAGAQYNLSIALAAMAEVSGQDACALLGRAIACGKGALAVFTVQAFPVRHHQVTSTLRRHREAYESRCGTKLKPFDEIEPAP